MNAVPSVILEVLHGRHGDSRRPCPQCDRGPHDAAVSVRVLAARNDTPGDALRHDGAQPGSWELNP